MKGGTIMAIMNNPQTNPQYQQYAGYGYNPLADMQQRVMNNPYLRGFPTQQPTGLPGKYIHNLNDIVVSEVPQDGSVAFFPTNDFSKIYAKAWTADGKIQTEEYVLAKDSKHSEKTFESVIFERLDRIENMLSQRKEVMADVKSKSDD